VIAGSNLVRPTERSMPLSVVLVRNQRKMTWVWNQITGQGLIRVDETKTAAGRRTIALPWFAIDVLRQRRSFPYVGQHPVIMFPSTAATWRDPNNFGRDWRRAQRNWVCRT
jgi:hypothetical protein